MHGLVPLHPDLITEQNISIPEGYHNGNGYVKTTNFLTNEEKIVVIPAGYHNGNGYVKINKTMTNAKHCNLNTDITCDIDVNTGANCLLTPGGCGIDTSPFCFSDTSGCSVNISLECG